ncbi:MAG: AIR synthase-related protein, partial [Bacteroidales bacterium]|nr:AIR synthase-related protein [Bacteroidales bacterium]
AGIKLADIEEVSSMTDITGFGLLGHALEMAEGSGLKAIIDYSKVPRIEGCEEYISKECIPGGTNRNFASYGEKISKMTPQQRALLCDPQTSGGLLIAVEPNGVSKVEELAVSEGFTITEIGYLSAKSGVFFIEVI